MAAHYLEFERPIGELEAKIEELSKLSDSAGPGALDAEIAAYQVRPADRSAWVEGVITAPAYMNSFTDKADKIAY